MNLVQNSLRLCTLLTMFTCLGQSLNAGHHSSSSSSSSSSASYRPNSLYGCWQPLNNQPNFISYDLTDPNDPVPYSGGAAEPRLLTDGSVVVQNIGYWGTPEFWKLTPDEYGSYVNGTWSQMSSLQYTPIYTAGAMLADGRFLIAGGEYSNWSFDFLINSNRCAIYDPLEDAWTNFDGPPFFTDLYTPRAQFAPSVIGDAACVVLEDGTVMLQDKMSTQAALLDLKTLTWKPTGAVSKAPFWNDEEGLTLLPDGKVLTVNCYTESHFLPNMYPRPAPEDMTHSQIYDPKTGKWESAGSTINSLVDVPTSEIGPGVLRPDGTVFWVGGTGNTSVYNSHTKTWSVGPRLPYGPCEQGQLGVQDGPGVLLTNGTVLFAASPIDPPFAPPVHFFVYDGSTLVEQPTIPNATQFNPSIGDSDGSWNTYMLLLPTGQVLLTDLSNDIEIYTPEDKSYNSDWAPVIRDCPKKVSPGHTYKIKGIRFNGMSQASVYGDEGTNATNYPLVRVTHTETGRVHYCRTHDHSYMGVASDKEVSTYFDVPSNIAHGKYTLEVVANGIPSESRKIYINHSGDSQ